MEAWPTGLRLAEPLKMTSLMVSPRKLRAELSPITQRTASMMLDLPQPLGPTMPIRLLGKYRTVGSTNDLNPTSLILLSRMGVVAASVPVQARRTSGRNTASTASRSGMTTACP